jgi:hypothetical protein
MTSGWTAIGDNGSAGPNFMVFGWWYRELQGGDSDPTVTHSTGGAYQAVILTFSGVDAADPFSGDKWGKDQSSNVGGTDWTFTSNDQTGNPAPYNSADDGVLALAIHGKETGVVNSLKSGSEQGFAQIYQYTRVSGAGGLTRNGLCVASKAVGVETVAMPTFTAGNTFGNLAGYIFLKP